MLPLPGNAFAHIIGHFACPDCALSMLGGLRPNRRKCA